MSYPEEDEEEYDDFYVHWTDQITNGVGIAWLIALLFWSYVVFTTWQTPEMSVGIGFVLIWIILLILAPVAMTVGPLVATIAILGTSLALIALFFRAGFRERSSVMIGAAGCTAISFAGILATAFLSIKALAEAWP